MSAILCCGWQSGFSASLAGVPGHGARGGVSAPPSTERAAAEVARRAPVLDLNALPNLEAVVPTLAAKRLVFIGESHERFEHHLVQLAIIARLYERNPALAVGMEFFQIPFQPYLDEYVAGRSDDKTLLEATEYFDRWGFDFRHYQPILKFAQEHQIPVVALNAAKELVENVSERGVEGLAAEDRAQLPADMAPADGPYRERLRAVFEHHPSNETKDFERFVEVQLLWDEAMAQTAAQYLTNHPKRSLVVLAGNGHLAFRSGIPERVLRRVQVDSAVVINGTDNGIEPGVADYIVLPPRRHLPPAGRMEVLLDTSADDVRIKSLEVDSAAAVAGVKAGDSLLAVGGWPIQRLADVRIALWDRMPGERIVVRVGRAGKLLGEREHTLEVELR